MRAPGDSGCLVLSGQSVHRIGLGRAWQEGRGRGLLPPLQPPAPAALHAGRTLRKAAPRLESQVERVREECTMTKASSVCELEPRVLLFLHLFILAFILISPPIVD